jgi:hypothetical protein
MILPRKFQLAGVVWKVVLVDMDDQGLCDFESATIYVRKSLCTQIQEVAFFHEVVHAIKYTLGHTLPHDEVEVDGMGHLLHQFMLSAK